jgi:hypothetical protein
LLSHQGNELAQYGLKCQVDSGAVTHTVYQKK